MYLFINVCVLPFVDFLCFLVVIETIFAVPSSYRLLLLYIIWRHWFCFFIGGTRLIVCFAFVVVFNWAFSFNQKSFLRKQFADVVYFGTGVVHRRTIGRGCTWTVIVWLVSGNKSIWNWYSSSFTFEVQLTITILEKKCVTNKNDFTVWIVLVLYDVRGRTGNNVRPVPSWKQYKCILWKQRHRWEHWNTCFGRVYEYDYLKC